MLGLGTRTPVQVRGSVVQTSGRCGSENVQRVDAADVATRGRKSGSTASCDCLRRQKQKTG